MQITDFTVVLQNQLSWKIKMNFSYLLSLRLILIIAVKEILVFHIALIQITCELISRRAVGVGL